MANLRELLESPAQAGYDRAEGVSQPAQSALRDLRSALSDQLPSGDYRIRVSGTAPNLPEVPWIAVLDPEVTTTAKQGIYVVYLYSADMSTLYLSLNQGVTAHQEAERGLGGAGRLAERVERRLKAEADAIRAELGGDLLARWNSPVLLRSDSELASFYEAANMAAIKYDLRAMPDSQELQSDLVEALEIYEAAVAAKAYLSATDPRTFSTPARALAPPRDKPFRFRPKNDADYVTAVTARTQVRTRRHETVVRQYGEYLLSRGFQVSTDVHPRDMVVGASGDHPEVLVEVKTIGVNSESAVREAIGQLVTYSYFYYGRDRPHHRMAVFSGNPGEAFVQLLEHEGIAVVWREDGWRGSETAVRLGMATP